MSRDFLLPDLGEGIHEAQIVRVLVSEGDNVAEDQAILEVETDKAAVEIPSPYAGIAEKVHVEEGQTVKVGAAMITFGGDAAAKASAHAKAKKSAGAESGGSASATATLAPPAAATPPANKTVAAAPAVRKLARQMGVDLNSLIGSGPGGRVVRADVEAAASGSVAPSPAAQAPAPAVTPTAPPPAPLPGRADMDKWGPTRRAPFSQIRKTIATQMARSAYTAPHVTHTDDADITDLESMRKSIKALPGQPERKLTLMPFVIKAISNALQRCPDLNATFDHEAGEMVYKDYVNIGIAVDTPRGLVVPVLRNVEQLGLLAIADALASLADKARQAQFSVDELRGGSFTITNVGALGGRYTTPIINYPEVGILGLGRSRKEPTVINDQIVPRMILPLSLSFDHRATDGAQAARFTRDVVIQLESVIGMML